MTKTKNERFNFEKISNKKPTALMCTNVIWDLALNKEIFSESMFEWVQDTINWFKNRQEYQLIIKAHPAESDPKI